MLQVIIVVEVEAQSFNEKREREASQIATSRARAPRACWQKGATSLKIPKDTWSDREFACLRYNVVLLQPCFLGSRRTDQPLTDREG